MKALALLQMLIAGITLGSLGTKLYLDDKMVLKTKYIEVIDHVSILSCIQGTVETVELVIGSRDKGADCEAVRDRWVGIYK